MGGGGGSSSSSTTTNQSDERIAATDQAVVIQLNDGSSVEIIDPEGQAFLAEVLGQAEDLFETAFSFADKRGDQADSLVHDVLNKNQTEDQQSFDKMIKLAGVLTLGYVAVKIWRK